MKKRQITALLLALTLGLSVCACGNDTKNPSGDDTSADTSADTSDANELTLNLPKNLDYTGHTVTYLAVEKYPSHFKLITAEDTKGDVLEEAGYKRALAVNDLLGVEFDKYETALDVVPTLNASVMSGEDTFDFVLPHCQIGTAALVSGGLLLPWEELDYVDFNKPWWNKRMQDTVSVAGKTFFAAGDITMTWQGMSAIIFNKEYLERYKIEEDLYQLAYDGEWTLDKMYELASGIAKDNGDNKWDEKDQYGLLLSTGSGATLQLAAGIPFSELDDDGCPVLAMNSEKMYDFVEKFYQITHSPDTRLDTYNSITWPTSVYRDVLMSGGSFLTSLDIGGLYSSLRDIEYEFGILPLPKYDEQQEDYLTASAAGIIGVPINADPERTGAIAEALAYYSYVHVRPAFFDIVLQNKALRDEDSYNMLTMMHEGKVYDFAYNFASAAAGMVDTVVVKNNNTDFASYYASQEGALNSTMRDIYDAVISLE